MTHTLSQHSSELSAHDCVLIRFSINHSTNILATDENLHEFSFEVALDAVRSTFADYERKSKSRNDESSVYALIIRDNLERTLNKLEEIEIDFYDKLEQQAHESELRAAHSSQCSTCCLFVRNEAQMSKLEASAQTLFRHHFDNLIISNKRLRVTISVHTDDELTSDERDVLIEHTMHTLDSEERRVEIYYGERTYTVEHVDARFQRCDFLHDFDIRDVNVLVDEIDKVNEIVELLSEKAQHYYDLIVANDFSDERATHLENAVTELDAASSRIIDARAFIKHYESELNEV